jgi:hypothetical protein
MRRAISASAGKSTSVLRSATRFRRVGSRVLSHAADLELLVLYLDGKWTSLTQFLRVQGFVFVLL